MFFQGLVLSRKKLKRIFEPKRSEASMFCENSSLNSNQSGEIVALGINAMKLSFLN